MLTSPENIYLCPSISVIAAALSVFFAPAAARAQSLEVRDRMEASISKQKASVAAQAGDKFFTVAWDTPLDPPVVPASPCAPLPAADLEPLIQTAASANSLKPELIRAVIRRESAFVPCAVSTKGAMGLMQLMPATVDQFHVADPFDVESNIRAGSEYLRKLLDRFDGSLKLALAAYNAGPERVAATAPKLPKIAETREYVAQILSETGSK